MHKFIALWGQPDDEDGFREHYTSTHMEILSRWPHTKDTRVTWFSGTPRGDDSPFIVQVEALFESADDLSAALQSEAGRESVNDAKHIAETYGSRPTLLLGEED